MDYETQRRLICALGRRMWEKGWVAANDGNLSRRLGEGLFLVTPAGVSKGFLSPEMLLVVDREGTVVAGAPGFRPSSETPLHLECYRRRSDVHGVCHAHPPAATAFACARQPIERPILGEIVMSLGAIPCASYARTGTLALPAAVGPLLWNHDAVLLANHGSLAWGPTLISAFDRLEVVEQTAKVFFYVHQLGGGVPIPTEKADTLKNMGDFYGKLAGKRE